MHPYDTFALTVVEKRGRRRVDALGRLLPRVGLDGVLAELDHVATPCPVPGRGAGDGFTWEPQDRDDRTWWPQGVATTRSGTVLLTSWYAKRRLVVLTQGSRISVVDRRDPSQPRYGHVLLVSPARRPHLTIGAVPVHAGGIAVHGDLLYVADTRAGVRVFDLRDLGRVPPPRLARRGDRRLGRRLTGGVTAYGYGHVLPQLLRLRSPRRSDLKWSFLHIGDVDGRLSLVVGEYGRKGTRPRLARYPLDEATGLPALGPDGRCRPLRCTRTRRRACRASPSTARAGTCRRAPARATPATCTSGRRAASTDTAGCCRPAQRTSTGPRPASGCGA